MQSLGASGLESLPPDAGSGGEAGWWRALHAYALAVAAAGDPGEIWAAAGEHLPGLLDAAVVAVAAPLLPDAWPHVAPGEASAPLIEGSREAAREVMTAGRGGEEPPPYAANAGGPNLLAVPLTAGDEERGGLAAAWSGDPPEDAPERLEAVAAHLAAALAGAACHAAAVEAGLRRERFFSAMSHDLRTPITAIVGYGELLHDGIVGPLTDQQMEMVGRITQVAGHLSHLLNDILDLARLDAGRMVLYPEVGRLGDVVADALLGVEPQLRRKGLDLVDGTAPVAGLLFRADQSRTRQILVALLSNAVKFTEAGAVAVTAGAGGESVWIEVRDSGPGLAPGTEAAVFDEFLEAASGARGGAASENGLALAISRRLARAMAGDLVARNVPGAGAAFTLSLPLAGAAGGEGDPSPGRRS